MCDGFNALVSTVAVVGFYHWQMEDNKRSIPCLVDGFKPSQRKVLFSCFKRNLKKEIKVCRYYIFLYCTCGPPR